MSFNFYLYNSLKCKMLIFVLSKFQFDIVSIITVYPVQNKASECSNVLVNLCQSIIYVSAFKSNKFLVQSIPYSTNGRCQFGHLFLVQTQNTGTRQRGSSLPVSAHARTIHSPDFSIKVLVIFIQFYPNKCNNKNFTTLGQPLLVEK